MRKLLIARASLAVIALCAAAGPTVAEAQALDCDFFSPCATTSCTPDVYRVRFVVDPTPRPIDDSNKNGIGWTLYKPLSIKEIRPGVAVDEHGSSQTDISYFGDFYTFRFGSLEPQTVIWSARSLEARLWPEGKALEPPDFYGTCLWVQE